MVAAHFDRAMFSCRTCEEVARRGGDQREANSGQRGSCSGPKTWTFFRSHPSGGFSWQGCPRRAVTPRTDAWIAAHDRCDGGLTYTEQRRAAWLLLDVFGTIDFVRGLQNWDASRRAAQQSGGGR